MLVLYGVNYHRGWNWTFCKYDSAFIESLLYIYIYIYASGIYAAVDFSSDMAYSGTDTMLHLAELVA